MYQDPRLYEGIFNGKNNAKYPNWRAYTLNKYLTMRADQPEPNEFQNLVIQTLRNHALIHEVKDSFKSKPTEREALLHLLNLWDVRYAYKEPVEWAESQLKSSIMEVVNGIESNADYETAVFACSWPVDKFEDFIQRVADLST
jgi:hypothetical protein